MERTRVQSLKRKIGKADNSKLEEIAEELISEGAQTPKEVIDALTQRLRDGAILGSLTMGKLIVLFRDRDLYQIPHTKAMFLGNVEVLVDLLRSKIPHSEIEEHLCDRLVHDFEENSFGSRQIVLEALRDFGSIKCLDTLEMIDYDFHGRFNTSKYVIDAINANEPNRQGGISNKKFLDRAKHRANVMLGNLLEDAISAVSERKVVGEYEWNDQLTQLNSLFPRAAEYIAFAHSHLDDDLGSALNNIRKATEYVLKTVIKSQGIKPDKKEPIDGLQLPTLMAVLMDKQNEKNPEKHIYQYLESLQKLTTLGSHDQGDPIDKMVDRKMVEGAISTYNKVQEYFENYIQ